MSAPTYTERLTVPLRWWVQGTMLVATLWLAVAVAAPPAVAAATGLACLALMAALFLWYGAATLRVDDEMFHAGRASIPTAYVGVVTALDETGTRLVAGRDADARAYLLIRPYLKRSVKVEIVDPADPTPYWLVSTRRPSLLAAALSAPVTH